MGIISFRRGCPRYCVSLVSMNFRLPAANARCPTLGVSGGQQLVWAPQLANEAALDGSASRVLAACCVSFEFLLYSSVKMDSWRPRYVSRCSQ